MFGDLSFDSCKRSQERKHPREAAASGVLTPGLRPELSPRFVPTFRRRGTRPPPAWTGAQPCLLPSPGQASPHMPRPHELGIKLGPLGPACHAATLRSLVRLSAASLLPSGAPRASHALSFFPFSWKLEKSIHERSDWSVPAEEEQATPSRVPGGLPRAPLPPPPPAGRRCPHHAHRVPSPEREPQPGGQVADVVPSLSPRRQPMPCLISFDN